MVLVSHTIEKQLAALEAVAAAVESGELSESRIDEALGRITRLKEKLELNEPIAPWEQVSAAIGTKANKAVARRWSEASVTLVKNDGGLLPLKRESSTLVLWPSIVPVSVADEMLSGDGTLGDFLKLYGANVVERRMDGENPLAGAEEFEQIVVVTYDASKHPREKEIARKAVELAGDRVLAVSVRNPLDLLLYPNVMAYLAVYECRPLALSSAAKALLGDLMPQGKLPLEISPAYPFGWSAE
jgi:beta-N-acetylhexosaminidase